VGVRRIPLVEDDVADLEVDREIGIEDREPVTGHESLVDDDAARRRRDREPGEPASPGVCLGSTAGGGKPELEPPGGPSGRPPDDRLDDRRPGGLGLATEGVGSDRDVAPARELETFSSEGLGDESSPDRPATAARQEDDHDPGPPSGEARREVVDDSRLEWQRYPGTIARLAVRREGTTVAKGRQSRQRKSEDPPTSGRPDRRYEPDATGIVVERRVVERRVVAGT
jgi:hypothetical protein